MFKTPEEGVPRKTVRARVHNMAGGGATPWLGVGRHTAVRYYIALALTSSQKYGTV